MTDVEIALSTGRVKGTDLGDVLRFYGIPYAEDPVGDLRFAAPVRRSSTYAPKDARSSGWVTVAARASSSSR